MTITDAGPDDVYEMVVANLKKGEVHSQAVLKEGSGI
jgi:hypothetical protein